MRRLTITTAEKDEAGGLSGQPLKPLSLRTLSLLRSFLPSSIPIIGCGGISSGADALEYARAGASAVQLYTAFGYGGVGTARRIKDELAAELKKLGTTWVGVSQEATQRLAWKPPTVTTGPHDAAATATEAADGNSVAALIREAEELKRMLDEVAAKFEEERAEGGLEPQPLGRGGGGAGSSGGGGEEDIRAADACPLPPRVPPPPPSGEPSPPEESVSS